MQSKREQLESELSQMIAAKVIQLKKEAGMDVSDIRVQIMSFVDNEGRRKHYLSGVEIVYFSQPLW